MKAGIKSITVQDAADRSRRGSIILDVRLAAKHEQSHPKGTPTLKTPKTPKNDVEIVFTAGSCFGCTMLDVGLAAKHGQRATPRIRSAGPASLGVGGGGADQWADHLGALGPDQSTACETQFVLLDRWRLQRASVHPHPRMGPGL